MLPPFTALRFNAFTLTKNKQKQNTQPNNTTTNKS
jgi:hypothetical protein